MPPFQYNPQAPSYCPGTQSIDRASTQNSGGINISVQKDQAIPAFTFNAGEQSYRKVQSIERESSHIPDEMSLYAAPEPEHKSSQELSMNSDILYSTEFVIRPPPPGFGIPPHLLRPSYFVQPEELPAQINYTPLQDLSKEKQDAIRNVWHIPEAEINAMDRAYWQRAGRQVIASTVPSEDVTSVSTYSVLAKGVTSISTNDDTAGATNPVTEKNVSICFMEDLPLQRLPESQTVPPAFSNSQSFCPGRGDQVPKDDDNVEETSISLSPSAQPAEIPWPRTLASHLFHIQIRHSPAEAMSTFDFNPNASEFNPQQMPEEPAKPAHYTPKTIPRPFQYVAFNPLPSEAYIPSSSPHSYKLSKRLPGLLLPTPTQPTTHPPSQRPRGKVPAEIYPLPTGTHRYCIPAAGGQATGGIPEYEMIEREPQYPDRQCPLKLDARAWEPLQMLFNLPVAHVEDHDMATTNAGMQGINTVVTEKKEVIEEKEILEEMDCGQHGGGLCTHGGTGQF
ncbi:hypothetical protein DFH27DRAFT_524213 [Peziza echinospora]|nr:hypothetical protein DFH27DRAFT_524213 [Peziza echinospora]